MWKMYKVIPVIKPIISTELLRTLSIKSFIRIFHCSTQCIDLNSKQMFSVRDGLVIMLNFIAAPV